MKRRWKQQNDTKYLRQQSCSSFRLKKNSILCMPHYSNRLPLFIQFDTSSCFFSLLSSPLFSLTRSNETECVTAARVTTITCTFFQPHVRHATHTKSLFIIHNSFRLSHTIDMRYRNRHKRNRRGAYTKKSIHSHVCVWGSFPIHLGCSEFFSIAERRNVYLFVPQQTQGTSEKRRSRK